MLFFPSVFFLFMFGLGDHGEKKDKLPHGIRLTTYNYYYYYYNYYYYYIANAHWTWDCLFDFMFYYLFHDFSPLSVRYSFGLDGFSDTPRLLL